MCNSCKFSSKSKKTWWLEKAVLQTKQELDIGDTAGPDDILFIIQKYK